jgi:hypothetical protein
MSGISLEKRGEKVGIILAKRGINQAPVMRVGDALDISGSMDMRPNHIISTGKLQAAFDQTMGVAVKFDDNGELDVFAFDTRCDFVGTANPNNYSNFIKREGISARGGTAYAPIVKAAIDFYFNNPAPAKKGGFFGFGKKQEAAPANNMPVLMLIHTDGEPGDSYATIKRALEDAQQHPIYFHFVGVGGSRSDFPTIARLADDLPNVGEVYLPRFDLDDDVVYEQLICDELVEWIGKHPAQAQTARA